MELLQLAADDILPLLVEGELDLNSNIIAIDSCILLDAQQTWWARVQTRNVECTC